MSVFVRNQEGTFIWGIILSYSGLYSLSIRRNHLFVCSRQLLPVQTSTVQLGLLNRLMRVGGSEKLTEDSASSRLTMSRSHVLSLPRKHISLIQYTNIVHHDHHDRCTHLIQYLYIVHHDHHDRCGNDVSEEDAEVEVGVERRNEAELANIKTFCPVDLYLLCIIPFPKRILGNSGLHDRHNGLCVLLYRQERANCLFQFSSPNLRALYHSCSCLLGHFT